MTNNFDFHILQSSDKPELWDEAINSIPTATIFHTSEWLEFVEKYFRLKLRKVIIYNSGAVAGVFPFYEKKYGFLKIAGSPLFLEGTPYMGFAIKSEDDTQTIVYAIDRFIKEQRIDYFRAYFDNDCFRPHLHDFGYQLIEKNAYRLNISVDKDTLWQGFAHSCRKQVKKSIRGDFTFEKVTDICTLERHLDSYYEMAIDVYARQGLPP